MVRPMRSFGRNSPPSGWALPGCANRKRGHRGRVDRILVFMSGTDPDDVTARAAAGPAMRSAPVDVVVGAAYPFLAPLRAWAQRSR